MSKTEITATEDYGMLTANTVREFAKGLVEHQTATAEQLRREVQAACDKNLAEADAMVARCAAFSAQVLEEAEIIAKRNEQIFAHMTAAGKVFASAIDTFAAKIVDMDAELLSRARMSDNDHKAAADAVLSAAEDVVRQASRQD